MEKSVINLNEISKNEWAFYYEHVISDFAELKAEYPFAFLSILPTVEPSLASITVIAVSKNIIESVSGSPSDFLGPFSKKIFIEIPLFYRKIGCEVYGCDWIDKSKFEEKDIHLSHRGNAIAKNRYGYLMCVGVPESFKLMNNVILEAVKTAENMLVAYERVQSGASDTMILNAYSHGDVGKEEYRKDRNKYVPR